MNAEMEISKTSGDQQGERRASLSKVKEFLSGLKALTRCSRVRDLTRDGCIKGFIKRK